MDQDFTLNSVRTRLILSGLTEIEEHGINDFSLRRVAVLAQVSCAAPYRHFKDKEEFISEIIKYIGDQWALLFKEITSVHSSDLKLLIKTACISYVRFWLGNPNFRTMLLSSPTAGTLIGFDKELQNLTEEYFNNAEFSKRKFFTIRALVYGAILLCGFENPEEIISGLSTALDKEI